MIRFTDEPEVLVMWREAMKPGQGERTDLSDNIIEVKTDSCGTSKSYTLSRLEQHHPELFQRMVDEELSANAAAVGGGGDVRGGAEGCRSHDPARS